MSLLDEVEPRRSRRKQTKRRKQTRQSALAAPLSTLNDNQVLTFFEWCRLNRVSERNGRRILQSGTGPTVVQLSANRIGITVGANRRWQQSRERG
jgi:hypothetical protein